MSPAVFPCLAAAQRICLGAFFCLYLLLATTSEAGQWSEGIERETGVPSFTVFEPITTGTESGVNSISKDALGRLIVTTGSDFVTYDGASWVYYQQVDSQFSQVPSLFDTVVGSSGELFAVTNFGLCRVTFLPQNQFRLETVLKGVDPAAVKPVNFERALKTERGIYCAGNNVLSVYDEESGKMEDLARGEDFGMSHFLRTSKQNLYVFNWVGGLWTELANGWKTLRSPGDPGTMTVVLTSLLRPDGSVIVGTMNAGMRIFDEGSFQEYETELEEVGTPPVVSLVNVDAHRFAASLQGLGVALVNENGEVEQLMSRGLDYRFSEAKNLFHAGNGVVWASLEDRIARIRFLDPVSEYGQLVNHALPFPRVVRHQGRMHIIADFQLMAGDYYRGGALKGFVNRPVRGDEKLSDILSLGEDGLLCVTNESVYLLTDEDEIVPVSDSEENYLLVALDPEKRIILCASKDRYFCIQKVDGKWVENGMEARSPGMSHEFVQDSAGGVWIEHGIGTVARVWLEDGDLRTRIFGVDDGIDSSWVNLWSLGGTIYLSNGESRFAQWDASTERLVPATGLIENVIKHFTGPAKGSIDGEGNIWVPAISGHGVLRPDESGQYYRDDRALASVRDEYLYRIWPEEEGDIWMRGFNYVARYDPAYRVEDPELATPTIYAIEVLGRAPRIVEPTSLDFGYKDNYLRFHFTSPLLDSDRRVRYQCMLVGDSDSWIDLRSNESFEASNLGEGRYELRVRSTLDGVQFSPIATVGFSVEPPFYRTFWAYLTYFGMLLGLVYFVVRIMQDLEKRKTLRLQELVERRTRELDTANETLRRLYDEAEAGNKAKSAFIAMISHEMRTPLNAIIGPASVLGEDLVEATPHQRKLLSLIQSSAKHLLNLINDILTFSGKGSKGSRVESSPFDIHLLLDELVDAFSPKALSKGIDIECEISPGMSNVWKGDATRIRQIVINLLDNALKYTDEGSVKIYVEEVKDSMEGDHLYIQIVDTGVGVSDEEASRIFEPFVQGQGAMERVYEGTGLGLAICKQLVVSMGGEIGYEPAKPRGSLFWVSLPLQALPSGAVKALDNLPSWRDFDFSACRVLVAEDTAEGHFLMEQALGKLGCDARFASNGRAAVDLFRETEFDVVVLDLRMPKMDGMKAARRIAAIGKERDRVVPMIALSSYLSDSVLAECEVIGFSSCLDKPVSIDELATALMGVVGEGSRVS